MKNLTPQQEKLAVEIASALDDMDSLQLHRQFVQTYSETHLRNCLNKALSVKEKDIRRSRGALYTTLVRSHGYNSRD